MPSAVSNDMNSSNHNSFWSGRPVFLTGINGFIGSNIAKALVQKGAQVSGLVRNIDRNSLLFKEGIADHCNLIWGDLTDLHLLARVLAEQQSSIIFHLAAQVEVGVALANPYLTWETNVRGTYTLLDAIRQYSGSVKAIVMASSDKAYGSYPVDQMPYQEDYPLRPQYPYDTSKACADMIAQSYASDVFKLPVVVTRFANIYGPGQLNFSALIPDAITSALKYSEFNPRGDGRQVRDFIFVDDVVDLYLRIAEQLSNRPDKYRGEIFNAGTNTAHKVREVIEKIYTKCGNNYDLEIVLKKMEGRTTSGEIDCQFMGFDKVKCNFGWSPQYSLDDGLTKTIAWFEAYHGNRIES
jgi:CDP-glucose 4,6-dehydratase